MAQWLTIKNWSEFQHYKDRNPPWIKLHRALLDDYAFAALPDAQKAHLVLLWLFAASQAGGRIPNDAPFLSRKLGTSEKINLESLVAAGFLILEQIASDAIAECKQGASDMLALARSRESESERESEKKEQLPPATPSASKKSARAMRLPKPWMLPKAWGDWALKERSNWSAEDVRQCSLRFADYWHAKAGKDAAKLDWLATWRNWVRNERSSNDAKGAAPAERDWT